LSECWLPNRKIWLIFFIFKLVEENIFSRTWTQLPPKYASYSPWMNRTSPWHLYQERKRKGSLDGFFWHLSYLHCVAYLHSISQLSVRIFVRQTMNLVGLDQSDQRSWIRNIFSLKGFCYAWKVAWKLRSSIVFKSQRWQLITIVATW